MASLFMYRRRSYNYTLKCKRIFRKDMFLNQPNRFSTVLKVHTVGATLVADFCAVRFLNLNYNTLTTVVVTTLVSYPSKR